MKVRISLTCLSIQNVRFHYFIHFQSHSLATPSSRAQGQNNHLSTLVFPRPLFRLLSHQETKRSFLLCYPNHAFCPACLRDFTAWTMSGVANKSCGLSLYACLYSSYPNTIPIFRTLFSKTLNLVLSVKTETKSSVRTKRLKVSFSDKS